MEQPTVLCVENAESGFLVSKEILSAGSFRIITVTNPETAVRAFSAVTPDAAVFDCRFLAEEGVAVATRIREMDRSIPQFLVAPAENTVDFVDRSGLIYVVHDISVLARHLNELLAQTEEERVRQSALLEQCREQRGRGRELVAELKSKVLSLQNSVTSLDSRKQQAGFQRVRMSVCKRCGQVVALSDKFTNLQEQETKHKCQ